MAEKPGRPRRPELRVGQPDLQVPQPEVRLRRPELKLPWTRPERRPRGAHPALSRESIVRAAIEIADAEGLEAISMRRVAAKMGAGTMSLYWYVADKDELLDRMVDAAFGEFRTPDQPSGDWRADLRLIAYETRAMYLRHPWMAQLMGARPNFGPNVLRHVEFSVAAVDGLGLDIRRMALIPRALDDYVIGFTLRELALNEAVRRSEFTEEEWRAVLDPYFQELFAGGEYPVLARVSAQGWDLDLEAAFAFGLDCMLDGLAARIEVAHGK
jgi:AcrR family transcriptional regulator